MKPLLGIVSSAVITLALLPSCDRGIMGTQSITPNDVAALFVTNVSDLEQMVNDTLDYAVAAVGTLLKLKPEERTFDNTVRATDNILQRVSRCTSVLQVILHTNSDDALRSAAQQSLVKMQSVLIDLFGQNEQLYQAFITYQEQRGRYDKLSPKESYLFDESIKEFKRNGLELPVSERELVKKLKKELGELALQFEKNINDDQSTICVPEEQLTGLSADWIASLQRNGQELCILGVDYPTFHHIMKHCSNTEVRRQLQHAFMNRAYPHNVKVLDQIVAKREKLAHALGFENYAALDLDAQMVKDPEQAYAFLADLTERGSVRHKADIETLKQHLPEGVNLSPAGKFYPWDIAYVSEQYKKQHYDIDELKVAEYFPADKTVDKLLKVYEQFFGITFNTVPSITLWAPDVIMVKVTRTQDNTVLGYLILDLYPRANKYSHACEIGVVPALLLPGGKRQPAVAVVIANFPRATAAKPALLKYRDVNTFFHEFGHAIHELMGATEFAGTAGTSVKTDFVEMPSQMLEEWLYDPEVLRLVSHHYITGTPLPDELIDRLIKVKRFNAGIWLLTQLYYARISLDLFSQGTAVDTQELLKDLYQQLNPYEEYIPDYHLQTSFGHLNGYGAKYYGYLWSKVFALDLFEQIKPQGLLNRAAGQHYAQHILEPGGSVPPDELLRNFLGREPQQDAFLRDMGINP